MPLVVSSFSRYHHQLWVPLFLIFLLFFFFFFQDEPKPISVYHPTVDELSTSMGEPMEGFFDGVDVVFRTTASC